MTYQVRIAIAPDVDAKLSWLQSVWELESHNQVLRRLLGLTEAERARRAKLAKECDRAARRTIKRVEKQERDAAT